MTAPFETYKNMQDQVGRLIGDTSSASKLTLTKEWLNTYYVDAVSRHRWRDLLRDSEAELSTVLGERFVYLPKEVDEFFFLRVEDIGLGLTVAQAIENFFEKFDDTSDTKGLITDYADAGSFGRKREFSATKEKLNITPALSTVAVPIDIEIQGMVGENQVSETLTIQTAAGVGVSSANTYDDLVSVTSESFTGNLLTVTGKTSGNTYLSIAPPDQTARYRRIRLGGVPDSALNLTLYYKKRAMELLNDLQSIEIPVGQHLVHKVTAMHFSRDRKWASGAQWHESQATAALELAIAKESVQGQQAYQAIPSGARARRFGGPGGRFYVVKNG